MKTIRSMKAKSSVLTAMMVIIIVVIAIVSAVYVFSIPSSSPSHSQESTTSTGPSVMGHSGSRDTIPHSPPESQPR